MSERKKNAPICVKIDLELRREMDMVIVSSTPKYRGITHFVEVAIQKLCETERGNAAPRAIIMGRPPANQV